MIIRLARESDAPAVREIFQSAYGPDYVHPAFYDIDALRRMILGEDSITLVAESVETGRVIGTASVVLEIGAYSDLLGEFGRLVVLPEFRGKGVATELMAARIDHVRDRLHVGLVDGRTEHPYSQLIARAHGFAAVGFCPLKDLFTGRESTAILVRWFGDALSLRRNNPRVIPEVQEIATMALTNAGLPADVIVDDSAPPFPRRSDYRIDGITTDGYSSLLRIERGRVRNRKVFGPARLHEGAFKLRTRHAEYLVARQGARIAGAIGFIHNKREKALRIFELITPDDAAIQCLLRELDRRCREELDVQYAEVDISADAPRLQRTLIEIGFVPAAYIPAMVFHEVERLDIVRMIRVLAPLDQVRVHLIPEVQPFADTVLEALRPQQVLGEIQPVMRRCGLFRGLTDEQVARLAAHCTVVHYEKDEEIQRQGVRGDALHLVLQGEVDVQVATNSADEHVGTVHAGEAVGESGLLRDRPHTATAVALTAVKTARITYAEMESLIRHRPNIGLVIFRNLAAGLARKLVRADAQAVHRDE